MKFIYNILLVLLVSVLFQACSLKTKIKALKAAKVTDTSIRHIGINEFQNDTISQSWQINSALSSVIINNQKYFTIVNRKDITKILEEKRLNDSGLVDLVKDESSVGLSQMQSLLSGKIILNDLSSSSFYEKRTNYKRCIKTSSRKGKKYCTKYASYNVRCKLNKYTLKTNILLSKISNSKIIFTNTYTKTIQLKHCSDDNTILESKKSINSKLAKLIANDIVIDIAPSYIYFNVVLLESTDIELSSSQKAKFKIALKMIDLNRINKAYKLLYKLNKQLNNSSYVVLYDLAITQESLGNIEQAYKLYKKAEDIAINKDKVIDEISIAIQRVSKNIKQLYKVKKQL